MSGDLLSQHQVWNDRAEHWEDWGFGQPLAPSEQDLAFQRDQIVSGGRTLVLGATKSLCELALERTDSVVAADFSQAAIDLFRVKGVEYVCADWITLLEGSPDKYDNIITDNGLFCLEYPTEWQRIAAATHSSLKAGGIFSSRFFLSGSNPPKEHYDNPNLARIMPAIGRAGISDNWMVVKPASANNERYPARYTIPPVDTVKEVFKDFTVVDELVPDYEEGEHFVSLAFRTRA